MATRVGILLSTLMMIALTSCERSKSRVPSASNEITQAPHTLSAAEIDQYLNGGEITMRPSPNRTVSGDLRPWWIVAGRIKNDYYRDLNRVRVRVVAYDKNVENDTVLDTAEFDVENIPALEAKAFRCEVQLLIFPRDYRFKWEIVNATLAPEPESPTR